MAAKKAGIPSIAIVSGAGYIFLSDNFLTTVTKRLYAKAAKQCTEMWFVNKEDQQMFIQEKIVDAEKTKVFGAPSKPVHCWRSITVPHNASRIPAYPGFMNSLLYMYCEN